MQIGNRIRKMIPTLKKCKVGCRIDDISIERPGERKRPKSCENGIVFIRTEHTHRIIGLSERRKFVLSNNSTPDRPDERLPIRDNQDLNRCML